MKINKKQKESLAKFFWDLAKLGYAGLFLADIFKVKLAEQYLVASLAVLLPVALGFYLESGEDLKTAENNDKKQGGEK